MFDNLSYHTALFTFNEMLSAVNIIIWDKDLNIRFLFCKWFFWADLIVQNTEEFGNCEPNLSKQLSNILLFILLKVFEDKSNLKFLYCILSLV